jgi:enoyl-CoA hydratase/carnithine racemase
MASIIETSIDGGLGRLVLNHPPLNILTQQMLTEMRAALRSLEASPAVRVLLVSARGKHFSAGADVQEHLPPHYRQMIPEFLETIAAIGGRGSGQVLRRRVRGRAGGRHRRRCR